MSETQGPLPEVRREQILSLLHVHGDVRVRDLVEATGVSGITVRRDIAQLERDGLLQRVHGGARLPDRPEGASDGVDGVAAGDPDGSPSRPAASAADGTGGPARTGEIGMLVPSPHYYWPGVVRGAEEAARRHGLSVVLRGSSYEVSDDRRQITRLVDRGVAGLVIAPRLDTPTAPALLAWLRELTIPVVLVERTENDGGATDDRDLLESVVTDHRLGARLAVRHLLGLGHRRVGLITNHHSPHSRVIRAGWADAVREHGSTPEDTVELALAGKRDPSRDVDLARIPDLCRTTGTTALLVHADPEAMSVVQHAEEHGLVVPDDLSVVAYDDEVVGLFTPPMTAVRPPRAAVGRTAVDLVAARLADPDRPVHRVVINPSLHVRGTSAALTTPATTAD